MIKTSALGLSSRIAADHGALSIVLAGRLDVSTVALVWREAMEGQAQTGPVRVDASGLEYVDTAGIGLLLELRRRAGEGRFELIGLRREFTELLGMFPASALDSSQERSTQHLRLSQELGKAAVHLWEDIRILVSFVGEVSVAVGAALARPSFIRWPDVWRVAEAAGVNAFLIVALIGFLMGLIMSFQSAVPLRQFGAEIYVANLLGLSMLRELGPLVTAILFAGRSGSAFAAELGTMKVNEEISALTTMGLDPVRFLVVTRVLASMAMAPLLTVFFDLFGLIGGGVVMLSLGYPPVTYMRQVVWSVQMTDFLGGLFKAVVFSLLVAGIGCQRGLRTTTGASAVGESTTSSVVSSIILIAVTDGIFAVLFYALKI